MTRRSINVIQFWLKIGFFAIPGIGFATAGYIRFEWINLPRTQLDLHAYIALTVFVSFMWVLVVEHLKLNRIETLLTIQTGINLTARATVYCVVLALSGLFFYRGITFARIFVVLGCVLMFILSLVMIHLFRGVIHVLGISSNGHFRVAIVGADDFASRVSKHLVSNHFLPFDIACFVALPDQVAAVLDCPILDWERLDDVVERFHCGEVLVTLPPDRFGEAQEILSRVQHLCVPIRLVLDLGEGVFMPEKVFSFGGISLVDVRPHPVDTVRYAVGKRAFDIVFSLVSLLMAFPLMLLIALAIKLTSRGSVFFYPRTGQPERKMFQYA